MESYWNKFTTARVTRRHALSGLGATGLGFGALSLIGCGSKDSHQASSSGTKDSSGLLSQKVDTTAQAVAGGTWASQRNEDLISLDPITNVQGSAQSELLWAYSLLLKHGAAVGKTQGAQNITGDAAESWEISPDAMQITFKLRQNHQFDPRPPTNGRAVTSADVKYSWDAAEKRSPYNVNVFNSVNPGGPVSAVSTPDAHTVVMKMAFPYGPILEIPAHYQHPLVVPIEADGQFNAKAETRGSGPYILSTYQQSTRVEYKKNPNWYVKDRPFFDTVTKPIISDYAAGLAQFETKGVWDFDIRPEDMLRVKKDHPEMVLLAQPKPSGYISQKIVALSRQPNSPMADVRVRRAASMTLDRDLLLDVLNNVSVLADAGLPVEPLWNGHLAAGFPNWIDPKSADLGEGQKYFKHDPAEAKKMLQAAGMTSAVKMPWGYYTDREAAVHAKLNETMANMMQEDHLFQIEMQPLAYASAWRDVCQASRGDGFSGFCYNSADGFNEDAYLVNKYTPEGKYAVSSKPLHETDLVVKARMEVDPVKRGDLIKQAQRALSPQMYDIPTPGVVLTFTLHWPWLQNFGIYEVGGTSARPFTEAWYDASKKS